LDSDVRTRIAGLALAALVLPACAARDLWPVERLDPETAVNVTIMAEPWVYARPVPMLAANARDYLNVGVVETNRAGSRAYWLGVVSWSTIDRSTVQADRAPARPERIRLDWQDGKLELTPAADGRAAVGLSEPALTKPAQSFTEAWYALSAGDVARLGGAAPASVSLAGDGGRLTTYDAWQVDPAVMPEFLKATGLSP
jgi:hypothetical protein